jgi:hypothetical protein
MVRRITLRKKKTHKKGGKLHRPKIYKKLVSLYKTRKNKKTLVKKDKELLKLKTPPIPARPLKFMHTGVKYNGKPAPLITSSWFDSHENPSPPPLVKKVTRSPKPKVRTPDFDFDLGEYTSSDASTDATSGVSSGPSLEPKKTKLKKYGDTYL